VIIVSVDPGQSTGVAAIRTELEPAFAGSATLLVRKEIAHYIWKWREVSRSQLLVVVEDYVGGGPRDKDSIFTLKLIGSVVGLCEWWNVECVLHQPQQRKRRLEEAAKIMSSSQYSVHEVDALAHALVELEHQREKGRS
jgi:hypothetical protein